MFNLFLRQNYLKLIFRVLLGLIIYFILISLLVYYEQDSDQSSLTTYKNAIWFSIVTLTTVGYGDLVPLTIYGRVIGTIFVFLSLGIYGLLIGQFTNIVASIKENIRMGYNGTEFQNHGVIIGWNDFGRLVAEQLLGVGKNISIVTNNRDDIELIHEQLDSKSVHTLFADFKNYELLRKTNIEHSSIVFVNLKDDTEKLVYILDLRKIFRSLEFVVTLDNSNLKETFISAGAKHAISKHEIASKLMASYMFEPDVANFSETIMSFAKDDSDHDIKQFLVTRDNPYVGEKYNDAFFDIKQRFNCILIGISKLDKFKERRLIKNPAGDIKVSLGDYLVIIVNGRASKTIQKEFNVREGYYKSMKED